jgi:hypothetical protein
MSRSVEYKAWMDMLRRCRNPKSHNWKYYGARGIAVKFPSFEEFFATVGPRPTTKHSIDRWPDNNSHYQPGNVRWATRSEQERILEASIVSAGTNSRKKTPICARMASGIAKSVRDYAT